MKQATKNQSTKKSAPKTEAKAKSAAKKAPAKASKASQTTTDHDEIRQWAEARKGVPSCVKKTGGAGDAGILRIDFPGGDETSLQEISWDEWFEKFDSSGLAFLYQDKTAAGKTSRFNKLVSQETANSGKASSGKGKTRSAGN